MRGLADPLKRRSSSKTKLEKFTMKNKLVAAGIGMALSAGFVVEALAQSPAVHVRQRQAAMTLQAKYFGQMNPKVAYDQAAFARAAANLEVLSRMPWDNFVEATKGEKSRALPAAYSDTAKFKSAQDNYMAAVTKLAAAAKSGPEQTVRAAWGEVNKSCAACHDDFRARAN
jgi:cytochrome c556